MGETSGDIENDIDDSRHALQENLEELEQRLRNLTDWRTHFRRHPGPVLLAGLAGGMLLAALFGRR